MSSPQFFFVRLSLGDIFAYALDRNYTAIRITDCSITKLEEPNLTICSRDRQGVSWRGDSRHSHAIQQIDRGKIRARCVYELAPVAANDLIWRVAENCVHRGTCIQDHAGHVRGVKH